MNLTFQQICSIVSGETSYKDDFHVEDIVYDSRKLKANSPSLFLALTTGTRDGHQFVEHAITSGAHGCIVEKSEGLSKDVPYILVSDSLQAFQTLAKHLRSIVKFPIIGITGSNGKTTVKEWLYEVLNEHLQIIKTPKSYNSQIGVAESLLPISSAFEFGIFEAGISQPNEMDALADMLQPTIGVFTNIGDAHQENFNSLQEKVTEKAKLFQSCESIIYCNEHQAIAHLLESSFPKKNLVSWGSNESSTIIFSKKDHNQISVGYEDEVFTFSLPQFGVSHYENLLHVISVMLVLDLDPDIIQAKILLLDSLPMRLEVKDGIRDTILINDSYTCDLAAFKYALDYMTLHYEDYDKIIITSQSLPFDTSELLSNYSIKAVFSVGSDEDILQIKEEVNSPKYSGSVILIKGRRKDKLERLSRHLTLKTHSTELEVHLQNIAHNLKVYSDILDKNTEVMAVIKASAYGAGSVEVGRYLSSLPIDYLAVALLDEGIELRNHGVSKPILVFNFFNANDASLLWEYNLEPEVYSFKQLDGILHESIKQDSPLKLHIKVDTGMHRLGFSVDDHSEIVKRIARYSKVKIASVFSHLSSSENPEHDSYTHDQANRFDVFYNNIVQSLDYRPFRHLLNTAGALRHSQFQYDAVRLGLGLYGIDETSELKEKLLPVLSLTTSVLQIRELKKGDALGYNRSYIAVGDTRVAVLGVGYADGLPRSSYQNLCYAAYNGTPLPYLATPCMDVCFVDISNCPEIKEGDSVEIFGDSVSLQALASANHTIAYEIISQIPTRVRRKYIED